MFKTLLYKEILNLLKDILEHGGGQPSGISVVAGAVVAVDQGDLLAKVIAQGVQGAMAEFEGGFLLGKRGQD